MQGKTSWLASNKDKRRGELFFLFWSAVWMSLMALIVATEAFEWFQPMHYMAVGVVIMAPCVLLPLILHRDSELHWYDRYTTKANIWCAIMAFVANYLWTHYFYKVLGASYTFKAHRLNDVPFALYLISHSYFISYHTFATIILRKAGFLKHDTAQWTQPLFIGLLSAMAYFVAYMETFTIQNVSHLARILSFFLIY